MFGENENCFGGSLNQSGPKYDELKFFSRYRVSHLYVAGNSRLNKF